MIMVENKNDRLEIQCKPPFVKFALVLEEKILVAREVILAP
jgi:hypothetical protein